MADPLGKALLKYLNTGEEQKLTVYSNEVHTDEYKASYFFRHLSEMPLQETKALALCKGNVLDAGAGAGCHSILLQEKGFDVTAIDTSIGAVETMNLRGVSNAICQSIYDHKGQYDTILMMMNGIGLAGKLKNVSSLLKHLKTLLKPGGQILADSSDIYHLYESFDADEFLNLNKDYLGEVEFKFEFEKEFSNWFNWVYLDHKTFKEQAIQAGFKYNLIFPVKTSGYLAQLILD
ncbi:MAG: class I SAM-dependent methyltransferase [Bacteroidia bacterium]